MRKTFKLFCAAVFALVAVSSCGKIEDQFNEINAELDSITARLDALEAALNADVANLATLDASHKALDKAVKDLEAALNAAIAAGDQTNSDDIKKLQSDVAALQAQLAGVKVEAKDGALVVTIGENSFTLSQNGVLTIVEVEGVKYWALVDPATGKVTNLDVKVGHDLKFKVDPETAEVLICYDGTEYVGTGVYAAESSATLIGDVEETDDAVTITIGDATYTLAKWADDKSVLGLSRSDFFLMYGATKVVELTAEDIAEYYVMAKPDGWKANLDGKTLTVVAPLKKAYEVGAAEAEGEILIHATTVEGKCKVAKLDVVTGEGLTLNVASDGTVSIRNAYTSVQQNQMMGTEMFGFSPFMIGIVPASEFYSLKDNYGYDFEELWEMYGGPIAGAYCGYYNNQMAGEYVEGEYEVDEITANINDIFYSDMSMYEDLPKGAYVVWVASDDGKGMPADGVITAEYYYIDLKVEVVKTLHNEVMLKVVGEGADSYMIGGVAESYYNNDWNPMTFDEYMTNESQMAAGPWYTFVKYGATYYLGMEVSEFPEEEFGVSQYVSDGSKLAFNENYHIWVMPMFSHMAKLDMNTYNMDYSAYDYEKNFKPYVIEVTTNDIVSGGEYKAVLTEGEVGFTSVSADVALSEGTESVYYSWYTKDEWNEFENEAAIIEALLEDCYMPLTYDDVVDTDADSGQTMVLATFSLGTDGKYGSVVHLECTAMSFPSEVNENLTLTFGTPVIDYSSIQVNLAPATGTTVYYRFYTESQVSGYETEAELVENAIKLCYEPLTEAADVKQTYLGAGETRVLVAVVVDADNKYKMFKETYTTKSYPYSDDITITLESVSETATGYTAIFNVTGASKVAFMCDWSGSENSFEAAVSKGEAGDLYAQYTWLDVVEGKATVNFVCDYPNYNYIYASAYNEEGGVVTGMAKEMVYQSLASSLPAAE